MDFLMAHQWCLRLPALVVASQSPPSADTRGCYLLGYISNGAAVAEQLALAAQSAFNQPPSDQRLVEAALQRWGAQVNQHLLGDYVLVWHTEQHLLVTSSAHSSFSVFYQGPDAQQGPALACDIKQLTSKTGAVFNPAVLLERLLCGPLLDDRSSFVGIHSLLPGQTLQWAYGSDASLPGSSLPGWSLASQAILSVAQQQRLAAQTPPLAVPVTATPVDLDSNTLFNALPSLAHQWGEPVWDAGLAHFNHWVASQPESLIPLDSDWLAGGMSLGDQPLYKNNYWCKGVIKRRVYRYRRQLISREGQLSQQYRAAPNGQIFSQWLAQHGIMPAWIQLLQRICHYHGKTLINPLLGPEPLLPQIGGSQAKGYFSLQQPMICNVFDGMQRLLTQGGGQTAKTFNLAPPVTASLVNQQPQHPRQVEQVCIILLTYDYLVRFHHCQLANSE